MLTAAHAHQRKVFENFAAELAGTNQKHVQSLYYLLHALPEHSEWAVITRENSAVKCVNRRVLRLAHRSEVKELRVAHTREFLRARFDGVLRSDAAGHCGKRVQISETSPTERAHCILVQLPVQIFAVRRQGGEYGATSGQKVVGGGRDSQLAAG